MSQENELQPDPEEMLPSFQPVELTQEDLDQIGYDLRTGDPARVAAAKARLAAAEYGGDPEAIRTALRTSVELKAALLARSAGEQFSADHPEYKQCAENARTIVAYLQKHHQAPTKRNMELAFQQLKASGQIILNEPEDETPSAPPVIETARGTLSADILQLPDAEFVLAVERMPADKYKQLFLNSPAFVKRINDLTRSGGGER